MQKVLPGQQLKIPASTFNTMIDAASAYQRSSMNGGANAMRPDTQAGIVSIRNQSGQDCERFSVLGLSTVLVTPSDKATEFASRFAFNAVLPDSTHSRKFVVLQEPIKNGAFGRAMVLGVTPVLVKRLRAFSTRVGIHTGQTYLKTGVQGAQILWEDSYSGTDTHLAVIRLPADGSGPVSACRFVVTDAGYLLTGLSDIDGETPVAGDLVLRAANDSNDGVWEAAAGAWTRLYTLNDFEKGESIVIWGGASAPKLYVRMTTAEPI